MVLQEVPSIWETDVLRPIIARAETLTGRTYGDDAEVDVALRILADHARSVSFLISDGVFPSNEDRGYVLRRLIRRAVRQAYLLGVERPVTPTLVAAVVDVDGRRLPGPGPQRGLRDRRGGARGGPLPGHPALRADDARSRAGRAADEVVSGPVAFRLHDTHGFPIELTREIAGGAGRPGGRGGLRGGHAPAAGAVRARGKETAAPTATGASATYRAILGARRPHPVRGLHRQHRHRPGARRRARRPRPIDGSRRAGDRPSRQVEIFLDVTPFYAEGGGQVGDTGLIETDTGRARVIDTTSALPGLTRHLAVVEDGRDPGRADGHGRRSTPSGGRPSAATTPAPTCCTGPCGRCSATTSSSRDPWSRPDYLRFDFTHYGPVDAPRRSARVEDLVNGQILADEDVGVDGDEQGGRRRGPGAIAFFEDKYGDEVRVVQAGTESIELCGGTHVARLGQIGPFEIISEGSIGSNLRRIFATTGTATLARLRQAERQLADAAELLRATPDELTSAVERKLADLRDSKAGCARPSRPPWPTGPGRLVEQAVDGWLVARADGLAPDQLQELADQVRQLGGLQTVVLGGSPDGTKVALVALAAKGGPDRPRADRGGGPHRRRRRRGQEPGAGHGRRPGRQPAGRGARSDPQPCSADDPQRPGARGRSRVQADRRGRDRQRPAGRTGVAVLPRPGDRAADHRALADLVAEYEAVGVVVGLPLSLSGQTRAGGPGGAEEVGEIQGAVAVEVDTVDERLTTRAAAGTLRAGAGAPATSAGVIDQAAAAVLLQTWVEQRRAETRG